MNRPRTPAAIILIWLPVVITAATWPTWSERLPDRMATHWNGTGAADGFSSSSGFWTAMLVLGVVAGMAGIVIALRAGGAYGSRYLLGAAGALAGSTAGVWVASATATLQSPSDPRLGWRLLFSWPAWAGAPSSPWWPARRRARCSHRLRPWRRSTWPRPSAPPGAPPCVPR